jgi:hypothetical protein
MGFIRPSVYWIVRFYNELAFRNFIWMRDEAEQAAIVRLAHEQRL